MGLSLSKSKEDHIQQAWKDLLISKEFRMLTKQETVRPSPELSDAIHKGEVQLLCDQLQKHSAYLICGLMALYERDDPTQFLVLSQLISRRV